jgi:mono/diheme cytochrome c family protein
MSYFHAKSLIALLLMAAGVAALVSMLTLMGRSERKLGAAVLRATHRGSGYVFAGLLVIAAGMGLRHLATVGDGLPLRGVIHWVLATLLVVVLGLKIVIARFYKQLLKLVPVLGLIVFSLAFVVVVVSAVFFLITGGAAGAGRPTVGAAISQAGPAGASVSGGAPPVVVSGSGDAALGEALFARHCSFCHYVDSVDVKIGPGLAGLLSRATLSSTGAPATLENVRLQLVKPAGTMPSFARTLSEDELRDLLAYLATL